MWAIIKDRNKYRPIFRGCGINRKSAKILGTHHKSLVYKGATSNTPSPALCALPGALRTSSAMGSYAPQTPCALAQPKHPLCVCPAPQSLLSPSLKEVFLLYICHIPVSIIKRSAGRSAVAC